jgi:BMFP domain-containing protein YqiC
MAADETDDATATNSEKSTSGGELRNLLRQLVSPVVERVEEQVSTQIDQEVAQRFEELLSSRMATIDRAIGDLDRHLKELSDRVEKLEARDQPDATPAADEQ